MKEIVIMIGPAGPDPKLVTMLKQLFPSCKIRFVQAGDNNVTYNDNTETIDFNGQYTNNG